MPPALALLLAVGLLAPPPADFEAAFRQPPSAARPHTWWHWMNGNITREGITLDLEAMKQVGLGGAHLFNVSAGIPEGPVKVYSPEWRALIKHAIQEADRLDLALTIHNCAGWSSSGGPWVKPEQAMQRLTWLERRVEGPARFGEALAQPPTRRGCYRDIAVLAWPTPAAERIRLADLAPQLTADAPGFDGARLLDGNPDTTVAIPRVGGRPAALTLALREPFAARCLQLVAGGGRGGYRGELEASDDGRTWRRVTGFVLPEDDLARPVMAVDFAPVTAPFFRLTFTGGEPRARSLTLGELELLGGYRLPNWSAQAGFYRSDGLRPTREPLDAELVIPRDQVIDLTSKLAPDGKLNWDVPAGDWTVIRFGYTPTGKENHPAPAAGTGLEVDKLSREALDAFFAEALEPILKDIGPLAGKSLRQVLIDSYEVGCQNWTPRFREQFIRLRGYDPLPWLPATVGRVVGDREASERFLWDFRRTIADLFAECYFGGMADLAHRHGLNLAAECYGNGGFDNLQSFAQADLPMSEFWAGGLGDEGGAKQAATSAHTHGRSAVGAESFTASSENGAWRNDPWSLKLLGDNMLAAGINQLIFHRYAMQPWRDVKPGMTMGPWGMHFERTLTWWHEAPAWTGYLARCQAILQAGKPVADLLYLTDEGAPAHLPGRGQLRPAPPAGYDYDGGANELLDRLTVRDGRLVLPDGVSYRVLVLPETPLMTPERLRKVQALVRAGATVYGPRPDRSPSLSDQPAADQQVTALAAELWGPADAGATEQVHGQGRVVWGRPLADVLAQAGAGPDVTVTSPDDGSVRWLHRAFPGEDAWFVTNATDREVTAKLSFRVSGRQPEWWAADTATIAPVPRWAAAGKRTEVTVRMEPRGSGFVVFRRPATAGETVAEVRHEGQAAPPEAPHTLVVTRAVYGVLAVPPAETADVTARVAALARQGAKIVATNAMAGGDPAPNIVKSLRVDYTVGGKTEQRTVGENASLELPAGAVVTKAVYGDLSAPAPQPTTIDVTRQVAERVKDGRLVVQANNELGGDPVPMTVKQLRVEYTLDGVPGKRVANENETLRLPEASTQVAPPAWDLAVRDGRTWLTAWEPGSYTVTTTRGRKLSCDGGGAAVLEVKGSWTLSFPAGWGAPASVRLDKLISWTDHPEPGVRYFSGTAEYRLDLDLPAELLRGGKRVELDLGEVKNFARVFLNGRELGVFWKPPFRLPLAGAARPGRNELRVQVTNLWPNRLIGDEQTPDDRQWAPGGNLQAWPASTAGGTAPKPAPGKYTWTTWHHYQADSPLLTSGLLGPVVLRVGVELPIPPQP